MMAGGVYPKASNGADLTQLSRWFCGSGRITVNPDISPNWGSVPLAH